MQCSSIYLHSSMELLSIGGANRLYFQDSSVCSDSSAYLDSSRELLSFGRCHHIIFTSHQHIFLKQKVAPFQWMKKQHEFVYIYICNAYLQVEQVRKWYMLLRTFTRIKGKHSPFLLFQKILPINPC